MSSQTTSPTSASSAPRPTFVDRLAATCWAKIIDDKMTTMNNCALVFIGYMGGAPKSNHTRVVMTNLGAAFGNYEMTRDSTNIIKSLIDTYITRLEYNESRMLACVIIGYSGSPVGENETDDEISIRVGAVISKYETPVVPVPVHTASASMLPKKPSDATIALIKKAIGEHFYGQLSELAKLVGINMDGIPPYDPATVNCDAAHMIKARLAFAVAQWEAM